MGQYYKFVNLDKKQVCQRNWHNIKLTEHSYLGNDYCTDILSLLSNEWKGDKVIHVGDYAEPNDETNTQRLINNICKDNNIKTSVYDWANSFEEVIPKDFNYNIRYVYNHDKKEYVDLFHQPIQWLNIDDKVASFTKFNSFALLTACGNGLGGGDYRSINENVIGSWAGDRLESSVEFLNEYKKYRENNYVFDEWCKLNGKENKFNKEDRINKKECEFLKTELDSFKKYRELKEFDLNIDSYGLTEKESKLFNETINNYSKSLMEDKCL